MISEHLRPSLLPRRRPTPLQWIVIVAAFALLGGGIFVLDVPMALGLVACVGMLLVCAYRFENAFALLLGLSMSLSYNLLLALRPSIEGATIPVTLLDFATFLVFIAVLLNLVGRRESLSLPVSIRRSYLVFAGMTLFGLIYGPTNGALATTYLRDIRLFAALHLAVVGVAWFIRTPGQLHRIANVMLVSAVACAAQQVFHFMTGIDSGGIMAAREVTLPILVVPLALMLLMMYRWNGLTLGPRNAYPFLVVFLLFAALLSFTRTVWASILFSYLLGLQYTGSKSRNRALLYGTLSVVVLMFVVPLVVNMATQGINLQQLVEDRALAIVRGKDIATQARLVDTVEAGQIYLQSPVWGMGFGYPIYIYYLEKGVMAETELLHNSFLYYGIKMGAIGTFALIWMVVAALRRTSKVAKGSVEEGNAAQAETRAFAQAMMAFAIPFVILGPWSAILNYIAFMPILGLMVGLNWDKLEAASASPPQSLPADATERTLTRV